MTPPKEETPRKAKGYTPLKVNMEPKDDGFQENLLFQGLIFRFLSNFWGVQQVFHT